MRNDKTTFSRSDGRVFNEMRPTVMHRGFTKFAEGSVLIEVGDTQVICNASVDDSVPDFLKNTGEGWITAEYSMLPRATDTRNDRGRSSRAVEIQRLIGRALRSVVDLAALGPRTIRLDCDVIQADGGTRTAAITGAFVALHDALAWLVASDGIPSIPVKEYVAATSVGVVEGVPVLDLCYAEDSRAEVDLNVIMTQSKAIVEVQGTAERNPFPRETLDELMDLAEGGIMQLIDIQKTTLDKGDSES